MKGENVNEKTEVQLERIPPAEVAWFALGSCVRKAGRGAGTVSLFVSWPRAWAALEIPDTGAAWVREIQAGENPERAAGDIMGGRPDPAVLAALGFESIDPTALDSIRKARAPGFRTRGRRYDLTIYGQPSGKKWSRARIERAIQSVPEGERLHFGFVELCDENHEKQ